MEHLKKSRGKNKIFIIAFIFIFSFALMTVNMRSREGPVILESLVLWIASPFQTFFTRSVQSISETVDHYFLLVNVSKENKILKADIDRLVFEKNQLQEKLLELNRLEQLLAYSNGRTENFLTASVVGRDSTQWSKVIFIDKGQNDQVQENFAVVTNLGIIGHVIQSASQTSKVLLINDSRSAVDAIFQNSRVSGVVVGTGNKFCDMKYVPIEANVKEGDRVISSGMGGTFPKGLMIGTVVKVVKRKQGLFQDITLNPSAELSRLEEVLVALL